MCVGVPMQVLEASEHEALCEGGGRRERVTLALIGPVAPGAHVLVHLGSAVRRLDAGEAREIDGALEAVRKAAAGEPFEHLIQDLVDREPQLPEHLRKQNDDKKRTRMEMK